MAGCCCVVLVQEALLQHGGGGGGLGGGVGGRGGLLAGLADPPLVRPGHQPSFRLLFRADLDTYIITTVRRRHYVLSDSVGNISTD